MRGENDFDSHVARGIPFAEQLAGLEVPPAPGKPAGAPQAADVSRGEKVTVILDRLLDVEAAVSADSTQGVSLEPRLRVDISEGLDLIPAIPGKRNFLLDVAVLQAFTGAAVAGSYGIGRAVGNHRMQKIAKGFVQTFREQGHPFGVGSIEWKDPNYGDPWVNNLAHPMNFCAASKYFRKRGYGFWKAFAGATATSVLWEYMWENREVPKSGHDLFFANLLGALACAHDDFGLAWAVSPLRFDDARGHYTEFYYKPKGAVWRVYFRSEPNGSYSNEAYPEKEDRPLFVNDYSVGAGHEPSGVSFWMTGVTDTRARDVSQIHGPSDVLDGGAIGVSVDLLKHLPAVAK
jgi:hypothetical protein